MQIDHEPYWIDPLIAYLKDGTLLYDPKEAQKLRNQASQYILYEGKLYKRSYSLSLLKYLQSSETDFALWKRAQPEHIMRWPSPWSDGFPGWHAECTAMGKKYLGKHFDIHGGGLDLRFPHHENELAQSTAAGDDFANFWMHNGMVTYEGEKMSKSIGNTISPAQMLQMALEGLDGVESAKVQVDVAIAAHKDPVSGYNAAVAALRRRTDKPPAET